MQARSKRDFNADKRICDAAQTPENWFVMHNTDVCVEDPPGSCEIDGIAWTSAPTNATFIAEARTGWPAALDEIERLQFERDTAVNGFREQVALAGELIDRNTRLRMALSETAREALSYDNGKETAPAAEEYEGPEGAD